MCKKHWYFEENLLSSAGQMWLEVAPDCLFLTYRWLESQAHIKKRNQVILKALWLLVPYDPNPTNHLGRCVILLMQNTPLNSTVSHSLQDVCDRKWQKKGKPSAGPFFSTATINLHFQT